MMNYVKWDYETFAVVNYYQLDVPKSLRSRHVLESERLRLDRLCIHAPRTPENDADVQIIEEALQRIGGRET